MALLITGGTGVVGCRFIKNSDESYIAAVSRNQTKAEQTLGSAVSVVIPWNPIRSPFDGPDVHFDKVVNLMGESIAEGRWTAAIYDSSEFLIKLRPTNPVPPVTSNAIFNLLS